MKKLLLAYIFSFVVILGYATEYESYYNPTSVGDFIFTISNDGVMHAQTFTIGTTGPNESFVIDSIRFYENSRLDDIIEIQTVSGGVPTGTVISTAVSYNYYGYIAVMSPAALQPNTTYAIVIYRSAGGSNSLASPVDAPYYDGGEHLIKYPGDAWEDAITSPPISSDIGGFTIYGKHAPIITSQPTSITRCPGTSATFTVGVDSDAPTYQWRKSGSNISGATSSSYTISSVVSGSAGNYDCVVTESLLGTTTTSSVATLTVPTTTSITGQPTSISRCVGASATFSVTAAGSSLTYQWKKNGSNISGATSSSYTMSSVATGDAANYTVTVTGTCGTVTSSTATLTVLVPPSISVHPVSQTKEIGESVTFSVTASGSSLTYQWRKDGLNISGETSSSYTIASVASADAGNYDVVVTNTCASSTSNDGVLTIGTSSGICSLLDGMVAYYGFDGTGTYTTEEDMFGTNDGVVTNVTRTGALSLRNSYGYFDSNTDYITLGTTDTRTVGTYSFWVYPTDRTDDRLVMGNDGYYSRIFLRATNGNVRIETNTNGQEFQFETNPPSLNAWSHIALVRNGDQMSYYLNGTFIQTLTVTGANSLSIGQIGYNGRSFRGNIDEISIYDRALTSAEVLLLYNSGSGFAYDDFDVCGEEPVTPTTGGKKILLPGGLRNIVLSGIERDFGGSGNEAFSILTMYDGVCPSGANRITDHDCANTTFNYTSPRKIKAASDYSNIVYIDPSGSNGNGTITTPYSSWANMLIGEGGFASYTAYLQKSGTTATPTATITLPTGLKDILLGYYGSGNQPIVRAVGAINAFNVSSDSVTFSGLDISTPDYTWYYSSYMNPNGIAIMNPDGLADVLDIYNCTIHNTGIGVFSWGTDIRVINNHIYEVFLDGIWNSQYNYFEASYNNIHDINTAFDLYPSDQTYSPGDGIQLEDNGKEIWIHNNIVDHSSAGNKQTLMINDRYNAIERCIIEYNELVNPLTTGQGVSGTNINGGTETPYGAYNTVFAHNTVYSKPGVDGSPATGLYITGVADSIYGNVFYNCNYGVFNAWHDADIISNNTFFGNNVGVYNAGTVDKLYNNIFWSNGTNYTGGTFTSVLTNLTSDPSFLNQTIFDFHLTSGSTGAIDQGTSVPFYKCDRGKNLIVGTVDLGAYEYEVSTSYIDTIQYYLSEDFESWTTTTVQRQDSLDKRLPMSLLNYIPADHSIVNVGGDNGKVWQIFIREDKNQGMQQLIHLGDTAKELYYQLDLYAQYDFNQAGIVSSAGKMPGGFYGSNNFEFITGDTVNKGGHGGRTHNVWGSSLMMLYTYDQDNYAYACGTCGQWDIPRGYWQRKTIRLNVGDPGQDNGFAEMYINGILTAQLTGLKYRSLTQGEDFGKIEAIFNSYQFGGDGINYASQSDQYIRMDNLLVYKYNPNAVNYKVGMRTLGDEIPVLDLPYSELKPDFLLHDEIYTALSDTIYDVGNGKHFIYNPPNKHEPIYKTVSLPTGSSVNFTFLTEEFGFSDGMSYVKVYNGTKDGALAHTFTYASNPNGNYTINNNIVTFEIYIGYSNYYKRGFAIKYWN